MKSLSAAIIVLAGAIVLTGGSFVAHSDTQAALQLTGAGVGIAGLIVWYRSLEDGNG